MIAARSLDASGAANAPANRHQARLQKRGNEYAPRILLVQALSQHLILEDSFLIARALRVTHLIPVAPREASSYPGLFGSTTLTVERQCAHVVRALCDEVWRGHTAPDAPSLMRRCACARLSPPSLTPCVERRTRLSQISAVSSA